MHPQKSPQKIQEKKIRHHSTSKDNREIVNREDEKEAAQG